MTSRYQGELPSASASPMTAEGRVHQLIRDCFPGLNPSRPRPLPTPTARCLSLPDRGLARRLFSRSERSTPRPAVPKAPGSAPGLRSTTSPLPNGIRLQIRRQSRHLPPPGCSPLPSSSEDTRRCWGSDQNPSMICAAPSPPSLTSDGYRLRRRAAPLEGLPGHDRDHEPRLTRVRLSQQNAAVAVCALAEEGRIHHLRSAPPQPPRDGQALAGSEQQLPGYCLCDLLRLDLIVGHLPPRHPVAGMRLRSSLPASPLLD